MPEAKRPQKGRIFISYRRADSEGYAGRIYDRLAPHFGDDAIFMDVDDIPAGVDFVKYLENEVQSCEVLIALMGKQWLNVEDDHGSRRLDNPNDFVRIEIATALKRDIRVIPVLLGGAQMPNVSDLPENLQSLTRRNGLLVYHHSFHADTNRLIKHLENALDEAEKERQQIAKEKAEREAAEKAAKENAKKDAAAKAKREREERQAARRVKLLKLYSDIQTVLKSIILKSKPFIRNFAIIGIVVALFWLGSLDFSKLVSLLPTEKPTTTYTLTSKSITPSQTLETNRPSQTPSKSVEPKATPTKTKTPVPTASPTPITATNSCGQNIYLFKTASVDEPIGDGYIPPNATFNLTGIARSGWYPRPGSWSWGFFLETTEPFNSSTYDGTAWIFMLYNSNNYYCVKFTQGTNTLIFNRGQFELAP